MADFNKNRFQANSIEWETPKDFFKPINDEFEFTLDVCATKDNTKASKFFSKEDNGLSKSWSGNICWMNPPYGKDLVLWLKKAKAESENCTVVSLIPARTNTKWWHEIVLKASEIRFVLGRPKFNNAKHGLPFPLALVIFKKHVNKNCIIGTYNFNK
jgi:site-specific DNA-methyltransferase (adenine-specific)